MIYIVGIGPGHKDYMLNKAIDILENSDIIIGFSRAIDSINFIDVKKEKIDYNIEGNGDTVVGVSPYPGYAVKEGTKINIYTEENNTKKNAVVMPNVVGYTKESASEILSKLGISYNFKGEGTVSKQSIPSGELINKGTTEDLTLNS